MPLPPIIQTTDTFNTWFDATNNLISHVANTNAYVLVTNSSSGTLLSSGNVHVNGTIHTVSLVANANVVLVGSTLSGTGVVKVTRDGTDDGVTITANNFSISVSNTTISGSDITIAANAVFNNRATLNGVASFTQNTAIASSVLAVNTSSNSAIGNSMVFASGSTIHLRANANATLSALLVNVTTTTFTGNTVAFSPNTTFTGTTLTINSAATFNDRLSLGGPVVHTVGFVGNAAANLAGPGTVGLPLVVNSTMTVFRVASDVADKIVSGIENAGNTSLYREVVIFNTGNHDIILQHANGSVGANAVFCPANTDFKIPRNGACLVAFDANTSVQRWRVVAPLSGDANTTVSGYVNTGSQSFAGTKTFQNAATFQDTAYLSHIIENVNVVAAAASGTINVNIVGTPVVYYTSNSSGNWTLNLRGNSTASLNDLLTTGQSITCSFLSTQGGTAYYPSTIQVQGTTSGVTLWWQNGVTPSVGASTSAVDIYTFVIVKTAASTYTVFGAVNKFA